MATRCRVCGIENADGSLACRQCGSPIGNPLGQPSNQSGPPPVAYNPFSDSAAPNPSQYQQPNYQQPYYQQPNYQQPGTPIAYPPPAEPDAGLKMLIPIGRSGYAIAAGYLGLLSLGLCFLSPFALTFGILAIRDIQKNPQKVGMPRAIVGIIGGIIGFIGLIMMIVVVATKK